MLDFIDRETYGEFSFEQFHEKLEVIYHNNKSWSTRKADSARSSFAVQVAPNQPNDDIRKYMDQMRIELR